MSNEQNVLQYLRGEKKAFCDDCLSLILKIKPRQQINLICRKLVNKGFILRNKSYCTKCKQRKISNLVNKKLGPRKEIEPESHDVSSNERLKGQNFEVLMKKHFESQLNQHFSERGLIVGRNKVHKFDLVSNDESIVIECKSYTWTESGNFPSAKITHLLEAIFYFSRIKALRKILIIQDDYDVRQGSLIEMFVRRYDGLLDDVEIWSFYEGKTRMIRHAKESWYDIIQTM